MATKQVTITVEAELLGWLEQKAAASGTKLSPYLARAARNWVLWEDAAALAEADRRCGRDTEAEAEAELTRQRAAEAEAAGPGR